MVRGSTGKRFLSVVVFAIAVPLVTASCGDEIEDGQQRPGQRCYKESHCGPGLTCKDRRCVPVLQRTPDAGPTDDPDAADATDTRDTRTCEVGTRTCVGDATIRICNSDGPVEQRCRGDADAMVCRGGRCLPDRPCEDSDGDGYGRFCVPGPDCDETDPQIHSGAAERCETPIDDNCNGEINESCTECCASGCGSGEFCETCSCTTYDENTCEHQFQPCQRRGRNNGFFCTESGGSMRCIAGCDQTSENPGSDCPTPNSACLFGRRRGICFTGCTLQQGCGLDGYGCLPYDHSREGICAPTNPNNKVGDSCDSDDPFDCEEGAFCHEPDDGGSATCAEGCRPFAESDETDCSSGHCLPRSAQFGRCVSDNGKSLGEVCTQPNQTCGADGVVCLPAGGDFRCQKLCRLEEGDADCPGNRQCRDAWADSDGEVGVCQ